MWSPKTLSGIMTVRINSPLLSVSPSPLSIAKAVLSYFIVTTSLRAKPSPVISTSVFTVPLAISSPISAIPAIMKLALDSILSEL